MCHIACSFDHKRMQALVKLGLDRSGDSWSFTEITHAEDHLKRDVVKFYHKYDYGFNMPDFDTGAYYVTHLRAPTSGINTNTHPVTHNASYLWHNGILRKYEGNWDTQWLCEQISLHGPQVLANVDGSFAIVYSERDGVWIARNNAAPLYFNHDTLDICSIPFNGALEVPAGVIFEVDLRAKKFNRVATFDLLEEPFYFAE